MGGGVSFPSCHSFLQPFPLQQGGRPQPRRPPARPRPRPRPRPRLWRQPWRPSWQRPCHAYPSWGGERWGQLWHQRRQRQRRWGPSWRLGLTTRPQRRSCGPYPREKGTRGDPGQPPGAPCQPRRKRPPGQEPPGRRRSTGTDRAKPSAAWASGPAPRPPRSSTGRRRRRRAGAQPPTSYSAAPRPKPRECHQPTERPPPSSPIATSASRGRPPQLREWRRGRSTKRDRTGGPAHSRRQGRPTRHPSRRLTASDGRWIALRLGPSQLQTGPSSGTRRGLRGRRERRALGAERGGWGGRGATFGKGSAAPAFSRRDQPSPQLDRDSERHARPAPIFRHARAAPAASSRHRGRPETTAVADGRRQGTRLRPALLARQLEFGHGS